MPSRETVLVVHGTFASPPETSSASLRAASVEEWWLPHGSFCTLLNERLKQQGSNARCWAHPGDPFYWSGANTWSERALAGRHLAKELRRLIREEWLCHVVAHSHGGNVLLSALEELGDEADKLGSLCVLGTPFYHFRDDTNDHSYKKTPDNQKRQRRWAALSSILLYVAIASWFGGTMGFETAQTVLSSSWFWGTLALAIGFAGIVEFRRWCKNDMFPEFSTSFSAFGPDEGQEKMLVLHSRQDEAFNFLARLTEIEQIIDATPYDIRKYMKDGIRHAIEINRGRYGEFPKNILIPSIFPILIFLFFINHYFGYISNTPNLDNFITIFVLLFISFCYLIARKTFFETLELPVRIFILLGNMAQSVSIAAFICYIRRRFWKDMRDMAFGLAGFPIPHRNLTVRSTSIQGHRWIGYYTSKEVNLTLANQHAAEVKQTLKRIFDDVYAWSTSYFDKKISPLQSIKSALSSIYLAHSIYYKDSECTDLISAWISMKKDEKIVRGYHSYLSSAGNAMSSYEYECQFSSMDEIENNLVQSMNAIEAEGFIYRTDKELHPYDINKKLSERMTGKIKGAFGIQ